MMTLFETFRQNFLWNLPLFKEISLMNLTYYSGVARIFRGGGGEEGTPRPLYRYHSPRAGLSGPEPREVTKH